MPPCGRATWKCGCAPCEGCAAAAARFAPICPRAGSRRVPAPPGLPPRYLCPHPGGDALPDPDPARHGAREGGGGEGGRQRSRETERGERHQGSGGDARRRGRYARPLPASPPLRRTRPRKLLVPRFESSPQAAASRGSLHCPSSAARARRKQSGRARLEGSWPDGMRATCRAPQTPSFGRSGRGNVHERIRPIDVATRRLRLPPKSITAPARARAALPAVRAVGAVSRRVLRRGRDAGMGAGEKDSHSNLSRDAVSPLRTFLFRPRVRLGAAARRRGASARGRGKESEKEIFPARASAAEAAKP